MESEECDFEDGLLVITIRQMVEIGKEWWMEVLRSCKRSEEGRNS